jgi:hypothetical protein
MKLTEEQMIEILENQNELLAQLNFKIQEMTLKNYAYINHLKTEENKDASGDGSETTD